jgi:hypothetical protein
MMQVFLFLLPLSFDLPFSSLIHRSDRHQQRVSRCGARNPPWLTGQTSLFSKIPPTLLCTHTLTRSCSSPAASSGLLIKPFNLRASFTILCLQQPCMMPVISHYHMCVPGHALPRIFSPMFLASILVRQLAWRHRRNRTRHSHPHERH